jgi:multiple sugar transport system substrate-binding protein
MNIVMDADALPPNPTYTKMEEFLRPKDYPNEWGCHEAFAKALDEIAIADSDSPFVQRNRAYDIVWQIEDKLKNERCTAAEAVQEMTERINERIDLVLENKPDLRPLYEKRVELQKKIDEYRKSGRKVPLDWISNPFHRKYYVFKGWAE